jgi:hypothetical protein
MLRAVTTGAASVRRDGIMMVRNRRLLMLCVMLNKRRARRVETNRIMPK